MQRVYVVGVALSVLGMASCVDHDYDLSKDIDMNVTLGGDITLPPSSTANYTMAQILNLDAGSSIKPVGAEYGLSAGDYVLVQDGTSSPASFTINRVHLTDLQAAPTSAELTFTGIGVEALVHTDVIDLVNRLNISDNTVDRQLTSLRVADVDIRLDLRVSFSALDNYHGKIVLDQGFEIEFPDTWTIINNLNDGGGVRDGHIYVMGTSRTLTPGQTLMLSVTVKRIDLTDAGSGQGLYAPGRFNLDADIVSNGKVSISSGALAAGVTTRLRLDIQPSIPTAYINGFTGKVNPDINIAPTSFSISDVPDFLKEGDNNLDISNPRIRLQVQNTAPVDVNINALLKGFYSNAAPVEVWIGSAHGTDPIMIKAKSNTVIVLSRLGQGADTAAGEVNVAVPGLGNLISTIPDRISLENIEAKVPADKEYTFDFGPTYRFSVDYRAIVPLAFGPELRLFYTTDTDIDSDELHKYNFRKVEATVKVVSTVPMQMVPKVYAIDSEGKRLTDITATIDGTVGGGTLQSPATADLTIVLSSTAANLARLHGVEFEFDGTTAPSCVGVPLNEAQSLKFEEIRLRLIGGVDIDLN